MSSSLFLYYTSRSVFNGSFKAIFKTGYDFFCLFLRHLPPTDLEKAHERAALQQSQKQRLVSAPWRSQWCLGSWRLRRVVSSRVWRLTKNQETLQLKVQQLRPPGCLKRRSKQIAWKVLVEWHCMFFLCQIRLGRNMKSRKTTWFIEERVAGLLFLPSEGIDLLRICIACIALKLKSKGVHLCMSLLPRSRFETILRPNTQIRSKQISEIHGYPLKALASLGIKFISSIAFGTSKARDRHTSRGAVRISFDVLVKHFLGSSFHVQWSFPHLGPFFKMDRCLYTHHRWFTSFL